MDDPKESLPMMNAGVETDIKELMGLFDAPAFARRGLELDAALRRVHDRCRQARRERLDMVRLRLRQWSHAVTGPEAWPGVFATPIEPLWLLSEADPPRWAGSPGSIRQQRIIARDLVAAVLRFNRRWNEFLERLNLEPTNRAIDQYNRYYLLEKECVMGSTRLAARFFKPVPMLATEQILHDYSTLPVPELIDHR